jgi:hypothetical protein
MTSQPNKNSKRSQRRQKRGFIDLYVSTRKGRRAARRSAWKRNISGVEYPAGTKVLPKLHGGKLAVFMANAGGSIDYH